MATLPGLCRCRRAPSHSPPIRSPPLLNFTHRNLHLSSSCRHALISFPPHSPTTNNHPPQRHLLHFHRRLFSDVLSPPSSTDSTPYSVEEENDEFDPFKPMPAFFEEDPLNPPLPQSEPDARPTESKDTYHSSQINVTLPIIPPRSFGRHLVLPEDSAQLTSATLEEQTAPIPAHMQQDLMSWIDAQVPPAPVFAPLPNPEPTAEYALSSYAWSSSVSDTASAPPSELGAPSSMASPVRGDIHLSSLEDTASSSSGETLFLVQELLDTPSKEFDLEKVAEVIRLAVSHPSEIVQRELLELVAKAARIGIERDLEEPIAPLLTSLGRDLEASGDGVVYDAIIRAYALKGNLEAMDLWYQRNRTLLQIQVPSQRLSPPSIITFQIMMTAYVRQNQAVSVNFLFQDMLLYSLPTTSHILELMVMYSKDYSVHTYETVVEELLVRLRGYCFIIPQVSGSQQRSGLGIQESPPRFDKKALRYLLSHTDDPQILKKFIQLFMDLHLYYLQPSSYLPRFPHYLLRCLLPALCRLGMYDEHVLLVRAIHAVKQTRMEDFSVSIE
eukprot:TRINITY_DN2907_c0_g1_i1.p1 TRINITY_DN2907_c0_g1~~TRINITY_DN2907_c0_g1_i1.p1  ORF type:complete len:556 (+),score=82.55 TRINITY_DN2907_c0_g1_i1:37-1704(+)